MGAAIVPGRRLAAHFRLEMVPRLDFFFYRLLCLLPAPLQKPPMSDLWSGKVGGGCFSVLNPGRAGLKGGQWEQSLWHTACCTKRKKPKDVSLSPSLAAHCVSALNKYLQTPGVWDFRSWKLLKILFVTKKTKNKADRFCFISNSF